MIEIYNYIQLASQILLSVTLLATAIVRLTPTNKDDLAVDSFKNKLLKAMSYLPTFGLNPRTKALEDALRGK